MRYWSFAFSFPFLLAFTGCLVPSEDNVPLEIDQVEAVTLEGTLQSLGTSSMESRATHLLRLDDGTIVYAYSTTYSLDDPTYLNQVVEAVGLLTPATEAYGKDVVRIDQLTVLAPENEEVEEVALITYRNESLGFALQYQSDWDIEEAATSVTFSAPISEAVSEEAEAFRDTVQVTIQANVQNLPVEDWFLEYANTLASPVYVPSAIGKEQLPAIKVEDAGFSTYYIEAGDSIVVITYTTLDSVYALDHATLFSKMLYSFDLLSDGLREDLAEIEAPSNEEEQAEEVNEDGAPLDLNTEEELEELPTSGELVTISEGYSLLESASYDFQMVYPALWYYAREGSFYYFSDEPAEASNALVTLEWSSSPQANLESSTSGDSLTYFIPFDDSGSFTLTGSLAYQETLATMAESLNPWTAEV